MGLLFPLIFLSSRRKDSKKGIVMETESKMKKDGWRLRMRRCEEIVKPAKKEAGCMQKGIRRR